MALVAGLLVWVVVRGDPDRAPFEAALDDLARAGAVGYRSSAAGGGVDVRVTAQGFGVGTVTVSGRRLEVLLAEGKGYLRAGDGVIPGASSDAAPVMVKGRWVTGDVPLAGSLPARFLTPKVLAQRLKRALDATRSLPAADRSGVSVNGVEVLVARTPAGELDVSRAAPHRLVRFLPEVGQDVGVLPSAAFGQAPGPADPPVVGVAGFAGNDATVAGARGPPSAGAVAAVSNGVGSAGTGPGDAGDGVGPLPPELVDQTFDQLRRDVPALDGAAVDGGALRVDTDGKVHCSSAGCTVTMQVRASAAYTGRGKGTARIAGPVVVEMFATITINGLGAGGCSTHAQVSASIAGVVTCSDAGAGPVFVRANRIAQQQAAAGAAPGQYYRWTVESLADVHVLARAQVDVQRLVTQLEDQQAQAARNPDGTYRRIYGSQQGAEDLQRRAVALQQARQEGFQRNSGTTAVVRVQNKRTGQVETWVATESARPAPREWQGKLDGLVYKQGKGHAEQTIIDALKVNGREEWQIVQGGVNRNVCIQTPTGACAGPLTARDIVIGGQKYRYQGNKTDYRTFWWAGEG